MAVVTNPNQPMAGGRAGMASRDVNAEVVSTNIPVFRRISWGAIFAGVAIALVTQVTLNALGLAVGAASIDPQLNATPSFSELGAGVVIWMAGSALLSLVAGGYVAGRMAETVSDIEGAIHGLSVWAIATLIAGYLALSGASSVIGGVANAIGSGLSLAGQGVAAVAPEAAEAITGQEIALQGVIEDVRAQLTGGTAAGAEGAPAAPTTGEPTAAERNIQLLFTRLGRLATNPNDQSAQEVRNQIVTTLTENTELTEAEAQEQLATWEEQLRQARVQAEQTIEQASGAVAEATAATAGVVFALMIVSAAAAGIGGIAGTPTVTNIVNKESKIASEFAEAVVDRNTDDRR